MTNARAQVMMSGAHGGWLAFLSENHTLQPVNIHYMFRIPDNTWLSKCILRIGR